MNKLKPIRIVVFASAVALLALALAAHSKAAEDALSGKPAPAWKLKDVNGKTVQLADFKGKVVILDFWATWCGPCKIEIPSFVALQKQYHDQGLQVIGLSVDQGGPSVVKQFIPKLGINYPVVMANQEVQADYGNIQAIPTTFIINRQGVIVAKHVGVTQKAEFEKEIKPLLKQ